MGEESAKENYHQLVEGVSASFNTGWSDKQAAHKIQIENVTRLGCFDVMAKFS